MGKQTAQDFFKLIFDKFSEVAETRKALNTALAGKADGGKVTELAEQVKAQVTELAALNHLVQQMKAHGTIVGGTPSGKPKRSLGQRVTEWLDTEDRKANLRSSSLTMKMDLGEGVNFQKMRLKSTTMIGGLSATDLTAMESIGGERVQELIAPPHRPLMLRDLMSNKTTQKDAIYWVEETAFYHLWTTLDGAAASGQKVITVAQASGLGSGISIILEPTSESQREVAEIASVDIDAGTVTVVSNLTKTHPDGVDLTASEFTPTALTQLKPNAKITMSPKTSPVKTVAHMISLPKQVLDDYDQLRAHIDDQLLYGLGLVEEWQLLYGDGVDENLDGILTNANIQSLNWSDGETGDKKVDAIRRGITLATLANYPVDALVLHPLDFEDIELTKGSDGHYLVKVPSSDGETSRLWRVRVVETTAIAEGSCLIGSFSLGAKFWDRQQSGIQLATQHSDHFARNMVDILAEQRVALTVMRPPAFVELTFDGAPGGGGS